MSMKIGNYTFSIFLIVLAIGYFLEANNAQFSSNASYLPTVLSILLIILSLISMVQTFRTQNETISIQNLKLIFIVAGITLLFIVSWHLFGLFYMLSFLYVIILLTILDHQRKFQIRPFLFRIVYTSCLILVIYVLFEHFMMIRL